jgi:hypothetical protein
MQFSSDPFEAKKEIEEYSKRPHLTLDEIDNIMSALIEVMEKINNLKK